MDKDLKKERGGSNSRLSGKWNNKSLMEEEQKKVGSSKQRLLISHFHPGPPGHAAVVLRLFVIVLKLFKDCRQVSLLLCMYLFFLKVCQITDKHNLSLN